MSNLMNATFSVGLSIAKAVVTSDPTANQPAISLEFQRAMQSLMQSSTPVDVADCWSGTVTLSAGAASLDLTNLTQLGLGTVNATGLKLRALGWSALAANSNPISIAPAGSNGYSGFGTIGPINPGAWGLLYQASAGAIGSTAKNLSITGTGTDAILLWMAFGAL